MKRKNWKYRSSTERRYESALQQAAKAIGKAIKGSSTLQQIQIALLKFTHNPKFIEWAQIEALKMVGSVLVENAKTWREAAASSGHSREIHLLLKAEFANKPAFKQLVRENADYIKSLPQSVAKQVTSEAARKAIAGVRPEQLTKEIMAKVPDIAEWQARRIARTEVAKTQSNITQIKAQEVGIDWFVWETSQDQRTRSSHAHMQGVICNYNALPDPEKLNGEKSQFGPYGPGCVPNCRCYAAPVVDADFIKWPAKVVVNGQIVRVSKKQFLTIQ